MFNDQIFRVFHRRRRITCVPSFPLCRCRLLDERNKARENAAGAFTQELVGEKGVAQNVADVPPEGKEVRSSRVNRSTIDTDFSSIS